MPQSPRVSPRFARAYVVLMLLVGVSASAQDADQLWADYGHYVRIAQPELAGEAAEALVKLPPADVLDAVEAGRFENPGSIFQRAAGMESIQDVSSQLSEMVQGARLDRSREEQRIANDIEMLNQGQRAFQNATQRLSAAGQFAAPQMLAALVDQSKSDLHAAITRSMIEIGRPLVAPLSIALPQLPAVTQGQVARVLAEIGYPQAMPALREVIDNQQTDATARQVAQAAIDRLASGARMSANTSAAELYLALGEGAYRTATSTPAAVDGYDESNDTGVVWKYNKQLTLNGGPGLVAIVVPGAILGDAVAMQAAETALELDRDLSAALSLYLAANLRRENRLPEGENDASYPSSRQAPRYYAMVAGPQRLQDVLDRALADDDAELALDAIAGLSATASLDALQPLIRGLGYPDRRVRFRSAEALARAMPTESFNNDYRVVPVLADGVRQTNSPTALVIAESQDERNELLGAISGQGFRTLDAANVGAASGLVNNAPGIDLILIRGNQAAVRQAIEATSSNYKLAVTPILVAADSASQARLSADYDSDPRVTVVAADAENLANSVDLANTNFSGIAQETQDSSEFAITALSLLEQIAVQESVYNVNDALPALMEAAEDERADVATGATDVLRHIDNPDAQAAIAAAAFNASGETQIAQLIDLAESANAHGNLLPADMTDQLLELVKSSTGDTANAAAQAHGALALPTSNAVELIVQP